MRKKTSFHIPKQLYTKLHCNIARTSLVVDPIYGVGCAPVYVSDVDRCRIMYDKDGRIIDVRDDKSTIYVQSQTVGLTVPFKAISDHAEITDELVLADRLIECIIEQEEIKFIKLLNYAIKNYGAICSEDEEPTVENFHKLVITLFKEIEQYDLRVGCILLNRDFYLGKIVPVLHHPKIPLDIVTDKLLINLGIVASFLGAQIKVSNNIPYGRIYVLPEPEYLGILPISEDFSFERESSSLRVEYSSGMAIHNAEPTACGIYSRSAFN